MPRHPRHSTARGLFTSLTLPSLLLLLGQSVDVHGQLSNSSQLSLAAQDAGTHLETALSTPTANCTFAPADDGSLDNIYTITTHDWNSTALLFTFYSALPNTCPGWGGLHLLHTPTQADPDGVITLRVPNIWPDLINSSCVDRTLALAKPDPSATITNCTQAVPPPQGGAVSRPANQSLPANGGRNASGSAGGGSGDSDVQSF
ncbi:MAG: hypothetical protein M1838_000547 [Thelocarpon superellum]|nr:MAG: hypothetical protein M1838_000547 [Thelocarpon superellum]